MPREAVFGTDDAVFESLDEQTLTEEEQKDAHPVAEVRWARWPASHVQVVTRQYGAEVSLEVEPSYRYGQYVELDRDGINKFIRNLRRARDQAFGKDE